MIPVMIGISSGLLIVLLFSILRHLDKKYIYGLILSGIGFLYVGFAWTELQALIINSIQGVVFIFLAYYGIKGSIYILALGYFLHGCWDLVYGFYGLPGLIPPNYDLFCSSLDLTICAYIAVFNRNFNISSATHKIVV